MTPCAVHMALSVTARFRCLLYNVFELRTAGRYEMLSVVETWNKLLSISKLWISLNKEYLGLFSKVMSLTICFYLYVQIGVFSVLLWLKEYRRARTGCWQPRGPFQVNEHSLMGFADSFYVMLHIWTICIPVRCLLNPLYTEELCFKSHWPNEWGTWWLSLSHLSCQALLVWLRSPCWGLLRLLMTCCFLQDVTVVAFRENSFLDDLPPCCWV